MIKLSFAKKGGFILPVILIIAGFFVFEFTFAYAYGSKHTHPALTYEAAEFYNLEIAAPLSAPPRNNKLSEDDMNLLMQGAREEDMPPRWVNHFYDPVTGEGWTAEKMGSLDPVLLKIFSSLALSPRPPLSANNWAKNISAQSDYARYGGNQTWQRAIELYAVGDTKNAMLALGHVLHLIEDMTVPDHTRGDTHAGLMLDKGSPYENWVENYTTGKEKSLNIAKNLKAAGVKPLDLPVLEDYFEVNANYSSRNFFSADTIGDKNKVNPSIYYEKKIILDNFVFVKNGNDVYPVAKYSIFDASTKNYTIADPIILSAYWERLSKQAVISGAGVINLFFKEAEEYRQLHPNAAAPSTNNTIGLISPFGELVKINNFLTGVLNNAKNLVQSILPQTGKTTTVDMSELANNSQEIPTSPDDDPLGRGMIQKDAEITRDADAAPSVSSISLLYSSSSAGQSGTSPSEGGENINDNKSRGVAAEKIYVSRIIDGDTITLSTGQDVRLIGMNTPEAGEECADEAKAALANMVLGKGVSLEKDLSETDKYDRLLRYIYIDGVMVNAEMLKQGYAELMQIPPDTKYKIAFEIYEDEARAARRGCLWQEEAVGGAPPGSLLPDAPAVEKGPYYGGTSWASGETVQNGSFFEPEADAEAASSTPEPVAETIETPTSTPEAATSTPEEFPDLSQEEDAADDVAATSTPSENETLQKILISEVQLSGQTADDEFIELYNPNSAAVSLAGWSIQYRGSSASKFSKKNFSAGAQIPGYGFYLVAHKNSSASSTADMVHSTFSMSGQGGTIILARISTTTSVSGDEDFISDKVAYYSGDVPADAALFPETQEIDIANLAAGGSFERKSNASSTAETLVAGGINENDGNAEDTDNNREDFAIQSAANPQNTLSAPEDPTNQHYPAVPEIPEAEELPEYEPVICEYPSYDGHQNYEGTADTNNPEVLRLTPVSSGETIMLTANATYYIDYWDDSLHNQRVPFVAAGAKLIIPEGVILKFGPWKFDSSFYRPPVLRIAGSLEINGTKSNPVIFTTFRDDAHGVPINMSDSAPALRDWGSLQIESGAAETIKIQNAEFFYGGGHQDMANSYGGAIFINNAKAAIDIYDIKITNSQSGIYSRGNSGNRPNIMNSDFEYNFYWGVAFDGGGIANLTGNIFKCNGAPEGSGAKGGVSINGNGEKFKIENNNFFSNDEYGLKYFKKANEILEAVNNFWGDSSGPIHSSNPEGGGDAISNYVNFSPWATAAF